MIDFELPEDLVRLSDRIDLFIRDQVMPLEMDPRQGPHGPEEVLRLELVDRAREAGLLSPHGPAEWGGLGLDHVGMAVAFDLQGRQRNSVAVIGDGASSRRR